MQSHLRPKDSISDEEWLRLRILDVNGQALFRWPEMDSGLKLPEGFRESDPDCYRFVYNILVHLSVVNELFSMKRVSQKFNDN